MGSFIKYSIIQPQCTQWVLSKELTKNSQISSIFPLTLKEINGFMIRYIVVEFYERTHNKWLRHIMGKF